MLDTPFYTRSAIKTKIFGEETVGVHEALDLKRFSNPFLMPMLTLRVPRVASKANYKSWLLCIWIKPPQIEVQCTCVAYPKNIGGNNNSREKIDIKRSKLL